MQNRVRNFKSIAPLGLVALAVSLRGGNAAQEEDTGWPKEISVPQATIVMYQPQVETFEGDILTGRAAVSVTTPSQEQPVFGAIWYAARVLTDRDTRTAAILDVDVTRVRFPNATTEQEEALARLLEQEIPQWELSLSLDRLLASLELAESRRLAADGLETTPPEIVFVTHPAILVSIEGEARLQDIEGSKAKQVVNTPFTIIFLEETRSYYLYAGEKVWYTAPEVTAEWEVTENPPAAVAALTPPDADEPEEAEGTEEPPEGEVSEGPPPRVIVATEPTELIVTTGNPEFAPIDGTELLYVSNTESDILLEIASQRYFIVLSGRWYASDSLGGRWSHVRSDELPSDFANIPSESDKGHLLVFVAGTEQAQDAVMDNQIPQTTAVNRSEASLDVTYDGDPQFEKIADTDLEYAVNTASSVIKVDDRYYACDQGVWFIASNPSGPWVVADSVPQNIYGIPPSSPVYNVTYVYVYETTPQVVYVGYYPGYMGSYVYHGTVVYGTGYYYPGWYGTVYYPRPVTWGFHVRYNPWYGWGFGFSYNTGGFTFAIGFGGYGRYGRYGWWGPTGYRRGYRAGYYAGRRAGYRAGYYAGRRSSYRQNIYNRPQNRARNVDRARTRDNRANVARNRSNNVYADRSGNVHRRTQDGWQQRSQGGWQAQGRAQRNTDRSRQLDRSYQSRQRGTNRTNNYQRSRSGGRRGGGRRR